MMLNRTMEILDECKKTWPLASRWLEALEKSFRDPKGSSIVAFEGSMADGVSCIAFFFLPPFQ